MKLKRSPALIAAILILFVSACGRTDDLSAPTLAPHFGTAADDIGVDVAVTSTGSVYSFAQQSAIQGDYESYVYNLQLRRYNGAGKLVWNRQVDTFTCPDDPNCVGLFAQAVQADTNGFVYALGAFTGVVDDSAYASSYYVYKLDANGTVVKDTRVGVTGSLFSDDYKANDFLSFAVDKTGNFHVAKRQFDYDYSEISGTYTNVVSKYSTGGSLLWQRTSTVGVPKDITVSSSGSVYVVGSKGMARYSSSGSLAWTKSGNYEEVMISGSNLYTRYRKDVRKHDAKGNQLWLRTQGGLSTIVFQDMVGDGSGNVYLSGKYLASTGNMSAIVRKLSSSGSTLWTKTYGTPKYDDARGIATVSGSEIYVTGETQGSLAHPNRGGPQNRDGYLRKLSSSGSPLWMR